MSAHKSPERGPGEFPSHAFQEEGELGAAYDRFKQALITAGQDKLLTPSDAAWLQSVVYRPGGYIGTSDELRRLADLYGRYSIPKPTE